MAASLKKVGTTVMTPDGVGEVREPAKGGKVLVKIQSDKYWPHWNIYYKISEVKLRINE